VLSTRGDSKPGWRSRARNRPSRPHALGRVRFADRVQRHGALYVACRALRELFADDLPPPGGLAWVAALHDAGSFKHPAGARVSPIGVGLEQRLGLFLPPEFAQGAGTTDITVLIVRE
jgi:hypothetical protein